ncbi:uncharacterized protein [Oscarella lobularis]|uniref:uncharacterized protein n=1 Tax=Oscarella lobularis TaxID=121494 RepID=UPI0033143ED8
MAHVVDLKAIQDAYARLSSFLHLTPVLTSTTVDEKIGRKVFFKAESFQKTGAFKIRGALNAVLSLKSSNPNLKGVATHSTGNHGQALAAAAKLTKIPCSVVVPENTSLVKIDAIKGYGANVVFCKTTQQSRNETCERVAMETNSVIVPPYDHKDVIAGQGTISLEFLNQVPDLDALIVSVSGGGLISGIACAAKSLKPEIKVFAAEPEGKELEKSLRAGKRMWPNPPRSIETIADGMRTQQLGQLTWPIVRDLVEKIVFTVNDEEIAAAMKFIFERLKVVVEPSGAVPLAAAFSPRFKDVLHENESLRKIGIVLCGGNVDLDCLPWIH